MPKKQLVTLQQRREKIEQELRKPATRLRLKELLSDGLDRLRGELAPLFSWSLMSVGQQIHRELGLVCFEIRTARFSGPLKDGRWIKNPNAKQLPKQLPWDKWSDGGIAPEPDCPIVCLVNPSDGSTNIVAVIARENGADTTDAEQKLKTCLEGWLRTIEVFEAAEVSEAQKRLLKIESGIESLLSKKAGKKAAKRTTSRDDPDRELILKAWQTGKHPTYAACAKALALRESFNKRSPEKRVETVVRSWKKAEERQQLKAVKARATSPVKRK